MRNIFRSRRAGWLVAFILLCLPALTQAQSSEITVYVGGFLGDSFIAEPPVLFGDPAETTVFNDKVTVGFRYAYFVNSHFAVEGGVGFTPASIASSLRVNGGSNFNSIIAVDTYVFQANVLAHLFRGPVIPYVTGGVGAVDFHFRRNQFDFIIPSETDFAWNAGGGIKIPIGKVTALRGDGRVYWMNPQFSSEGWIHFVEVTGGISILFDF
jgi:opacity protein-like surface antigen